MIAERDDCCSYFGDELTTIERPLGAEGLELESHAPNATKLTLHISPGATQRRNPLSVHFPPRVSTSTYATLIYLVTQFVKASVAVRLTDT